MNLDRISRELVWRVIIIGVPAGWGGVGWLVWRILSGG